LHLLVPPAKRLISMANSPFASTTLTQAHARPI
jgi:hypothetical protein